MVRNHNQGSNKRYGKPLIINSDQGSKFTSEAHVELLKKYEIKISMDGKGRAIDNIFIERFWWSIKYEDIYLKAYENGVIKYYGVSNYMHFYNSEKLHQSLDYKTPDALCNEAVAAC